MPWRPSDWYGAASRRPGQLSKNGQKWGYRTRPFLLTSHRSIKSEIKAKRRSLKDKRELAPFTETPRNLTEHAKAVRYRSEWRRTRAEELCGRSPSVVKDEQAVPLRRRMPRVKTRIHRTEKNRANRNKLDRYSLGMAEIMP